MVKVNFYKELHEVELIEPDLIKAKINLEDADYEVFRLSKYIIRLFYGTEGLFDMSFKAAEKLYEVDSGYWYEFMKLKIEERNIDLSSFLYVGMEGLMLDVRQQKDEEELNRAEANYNVLVQKLDELKDDEDTEFEEIFDLDTYTEKRIFTCNGNDDFTNVVLMEMDYMNSKFSLVPGIIVDKMLWTHGKKSLDENCITEFLNVINLQDEINLTDKFGEALYKDYKYDEKFINDTLSLSELFTTLKQANIGILYEKDKKSGHYGQVTELEGIDEGSLIGSDIIYNINSYDTPFKSLKRLLALEKSFKDTGITFGRALTFLYQEYFNLRVQVSVNIIMNIRNKITKHKGDFKVIEQEMKSINKEFDI